MLKFLVASIILAASQTAFAYPQFIGKGYHACLTCHYNPFGNGPLNDYGRGVAATGIAGRLFIPDSVEDQTLGERSSFFLGKPDKLPIKPSVDYRGIYIRSNLENRDDPADPKWFNMQAEISLSANFGTKKEYIVSISRNTLIANNPRTGGRAPLSGKPDDKDLSYTREAYVGYRVTESLGVYIGKMDKVYGIRIPDHNLYARKKTRNNFNASSPGAMVHMGTEDYDAGVMLYKEPKAEPDNEKKGATDQTGFSGKFEYSLNKRWRLGFSHLREQDEDSNEQFSASALILKTRVGEGSSIMAELGSTANSATDITSQYIFLQGHMYLARGLYAVTTYDQFTADTSEYEETHRFGPGIQWFPLQRFEFRADLFNAKVYASSGASRDSWQFLGQVHLWF